MPAASGEGVPIPLRQRLEWTDRVVVDLAISHLAVRVACVAGALTARFGVATPAAVARAVRIAPRDMRRAVDQLVAAGLLRVEPWSAP